jgi:rhamnulokinase
VVGALPPVTGVRVFGGGARSVLYLDALRRHSGRPVTAGPTEATALGNALVQGLAMGVYESAADARAAVASLEEVAP